jgi:quinol-cytochrome oxidoreductase complex cytochrome b subunit
VVVTRTVSIRWFIVLIAVVGIICAVVGTVLGAMKASGREHLTVSLLMIGECQTRCISR